MALNIHGNGVLRDVGRGDLDMNRKAGRAAAKALRADAEFVYGARQLLFDLRALVVGTNRAEWPGRGNLGEVHAEIGGAANADADNGRQADASSGLDHPVDHKTLHRVDAVGRQQHLQVRAVLRSRALRNHLDRYRLRLLVEIDVDDRHPDAAGGLVVLSRDRVHDRGAQRIFVGGALAAGADRALQSGAVELDVAPDHDVVDRNAGVLAQDVLGSLGDGDVLDHGIEDAAPGRIGLGADQLLEPGLDVRRQDLQCLHVKRFADLFDFSQVELHDDFLLDHEGQAGRDQHRGQHQ